MIVQSQTNLKDKQCTNFLDGKTELFYLDENDINYIYIKSYCKNVGIDIE